MARIFYEALAFLSAVYLQDLLRCQRGLPAATLAKPFVPADWQQAVREAESLKQLRSLLGEVRMPAAWCNLPAHSCTQMLHKNGIRLLCGNAFSFAAMHPLLIGGC